MVCKMEKGDNLGMGNLGLLKIARSMSCLNFLVGLISKFTWIGKDSLKEAFSLRSRMTISVVSM